MKLTILGLGTMTGAILAGALEAGAVRASGLRADLRGLLPVPWQLPADR